MPENKKKAVVIGASSGIGEALAKALGRNGYEVGLAARRVELLRKLQKEIPSPSFIKRIDVGQPKEAMALLQELIRDLGGMDLIVLNSGINTRNVNLDWEGENETINVNVSGFAAMANVAVKHFLAQNSGHIVGISSIAALRGSATCPSYNASKAFVSNYLEGLRHRFSGKNIYVTDIRPGLVDTAMIRGQPGLFWVATAQGAAEQILQVIKKKKKVAYITARWRILAWLIKALPDWLYTLRYKRKI
ncbi:SDR family NAD(P)-dependent oxidoreductase [bacterium]|nr:SDR family NAD(P)-dependent oxidoreductase [Candidatus Omnitrophota bacterium]MCG2677777.1 SDR family NAD(P)-dependent oxidoreductase [bacterium]